MNLLKRAVRSFLWRTGLGKKTASWFWNIVSSGPDFNFLEKEEQLVFNDFQPNYTSKEVLPYILRETERCNKQQGFILKVRDAIVEPERCLATRNKRDLIDQSVVYVHTFQYPYILPYLRNRNKAITISEAVLYDGSANRNYYHHFIDALSSLAKIEKAGLPPDIPFIINAASFRSPFFQFLYQQSNKIRSLNWLVQQPDQWIRVKELYKLKSVHFAPETINFIRECYELKPVTPWRKVFLSRDGNLFSRALANEKEVERLLAAYGYEKIYAEHLSVSEQFEIFRETKYLIALTGMGLVQQLFMEPEQAHIIEIMPKDRLMPEYSWLAHVLRVRHYDVIVGAEMNKSGKYHLPISLLSQALEKMHTVRELDIS